MITTFGQGTDNIIVTWNNTSAVSPGHPVFDSLVQFLPEEDALYGYVDDGMNAMSNLEVFMSLAKYSETKYVYLVGKRVTLEFFPEYDWQEDRWFDSEIVTMLSDENKDIPIRFVILPEEIPEEKREEFLYECNIRLKGSDFAEKIQVMTIPETKAHFKEIIRLYQTGVIKEWAVDTETTSLVSHEKKARVTTISFYDDHTEIAGACVFRHPELYVPDLKAAYYKRALNILDFISENNCWENKDRIVKLLVDWFKGVNALEFAPNHWTTSITEDYVIKEMAKLGAHFKKLTKKKSLPVGDHETMICGLNIYAAVQKLLALNENGINEEQQMDFIEAIDEVLNIVPIGGHNIKFDSSFLMAWNIGNDMEITYDTFSEVLLQEGHRDFVRRDLGSAMTRHTEYTAAWKDGMAEDERVKKPKLGTRYDRVELKKHGEYAATDGIAAHLLHKSLIGKLQGTTAQEVMSPIIYNGLRAFSRAEAFGIAVDVDAYKILDVGYVQQIEDSINRMSSFPISRKVLDILGLEKINPNVYGANSHCNNVLFSKEGYDLKPVKLTDAGYPGLDKEALPELISQIRNSIRAYEKFLEREDEDVSMDDDFPFDNNKPWETVTAEKYETRKEALEFLYALQDHREVQRLKSTYIGGINFIENDTGDPSAYYTNFNIVGATATGRLSSGFHGMPRKSDIKKLFISSWGSFSTRTFDHLNLPGTLHRPEPTPTTTIWLPDEEKEIQYSEFRESFEIPKYNRSARRSIIREVKRGGGILATGDFSQLEVYVAAMLSGCQKLLDALNNGWDVHAYVAQQAFPECHGLDLKTIKVFHKEKRSFAKTILFGLLYGKQFLEPEMAALVDFFFSTFPEIKDWIEEQHRNVEKNGRCETPFGRVRHLPDGMLTATRDLWKVRGAHRRSVNTPIQSTASDCAFYGCGNIDREFYNRKMLSRFLGGVHDSILSDAYPGELIDVMDIMYNSTTALQFDFMKGYHLNFDLAFGVSWGRQMEVKNMEQKDGYREFNLEGGDVDWEMLIPDLKIAHPDMIIHKYHEGEEFEDKPAKQWVPQNNREVEVTLWLPN